MSAHGVMWHTIFLVGGIVEPHVVVGGVATNHRRVEPAFVSTHRLPTFEYGKKEVGRSDCAVAGRFRDRGYRSDQSCIADSIVF